jgi:spermidine/putrescine transport system ATP-binding protein
MPEAAAAFAPARDAMAASALELRNVSKQFGSVAAVRDVSLVIHQGELVSLLGPSGSGKTTTLRMIAGFEQPTSGEVLIQGRSVAGIPPKDRNLGMVFQNYALFPHMPVFENVAFGLQARKTDPSEVPDRVRDFLRLMQLEGLEQRLPSELSGGQQQRVALARALVTQPAVLLLDEPLGALDRKLREELQIELKELLTRVKTTSIYVTHDQDEALVLSDRIVVMAEGAIEQVDAPDRLYEHPRTEFVATFVGTSNIFDGTVVDGGEYLAVAGGDFRLPLRRPAEFAAPVRVAVRPERVRLQPPSVGADADLISGRIAGKRYLGAVTQYSVDLDGGIRVLANVSDSALASSLERGAEVGVSVDPDGVRVLTTIERAT